MKTDDISVKLLYLPEFPGEIEWVKSHGKNFRNICAKAK